MSQSLNQRWRERPRCPAPPVTPGRRDGVVHAIVGRAACRCLRAQVRAGRTRRPRARLRVQIRRNNAADESNRNRFARVRMFSRKERRVLAIQILPSHHRAFHAGAVLGVVNALRFASTRPTAGPSGIDDASARHVSGSYAMVAQHGRPRERELTRDLRRRMLALSRQCRTALPPLAATANGARIRSSPQGTHRAHPHRIAVRCTTTRQRVGRHTYELRTS